jgi:hypothetical protein
MSKRSSAEDDPGRTASKRKLGDVAAGAVLRRIHLLAWCDLDDARPEDPRSMRTRSVLSHRFGAVPILGPSGLGRGDCCYGRAKEVLG